MSNRSMLYDSPIGPLCIRCDEIGITEISFDGTGNDHDTDPLLIKAAQILDAYFHGQSMQAILPVHLTGGTPFRYKVWRMLCDIPYGSTVSYLDLARKLSATMSAQAIGQAVHNNPVSILIPCHRVIGKNGSLTGFGGGLDRKAFLLDMEKQNRIFDIQIEIQTEGGIE